MSNNCHFSVNNYQKVVNFGQKIIQKLVFLGRFNAYFKESNTKDGPFLSKKIVSFFGVFFTENYNKNCLFLKIIGPGLCKIVLFFYLFSFLWGRLNFWERLSSVFGWCHLPFLVNLANWVNLHKSLCLFCQKKW